MGSTIPASKYVNTLPSVLSAGGAALELNGLVLDLNTRIPLGTVLTLGSLAAVQAYFGASSAEAAFAEVYFTGYNGATAAPAELKFWQYPESAAVPAYIRGGQISGLTLDQLKTLTGVLSITVDGIAQTSGSINLSSATSFSNAASLIQTALAAADVTFTGSITGTTLTVTGTPSGTLAVGQTISGGATAAGTYITALGSGTGGTGTYAVNISQTVSSGALTGAAVLVTYDAIAGAFVVTSGLAGSASSIGYASGSISAGLLLTAATGAVLSQGSAIATPANAMLQIVSQDQNWATFTHMFAPEISDMVSFAQWNNSMDDRYLYAMWDTNSAPTTGSDTTSAGYLIQQAGYSGTTPIYEPSDLHHAAFLMGAIASINFNTPNGRQTLAYRSQTGITPGVTSQQVADNLEADGYNYYGGVASAAQGFQFFYPGSVTGPFAWIDSYINQIWMNNQFQLALLDLLTSVGSIPYNPAGYAMIETTLVGQPGDADEPGPINAAINFGAIRQNVPLSSVQAIDVNSAAGLNIATVLSTRGWYLQISPASPQVRAARGTPPMTFWYTDGGSVQSISLASILIQ